MRNRRTGPGKPGPKSLPDNVKRFRGTFRPDRSNPDAPKIKGRAKRPSGLSLVARKEWERLAPHLHKLRLLTPVDRGEFFLLCEWWAIAVEASARLRKDLRNPKRGFVGITGQVNPNLTAFRQASQVFNQLADRFGLNPSARQELVGLLGKSEEEGAADGKKKTRNTVTDRHGNAI